MSYLLDTNAVIALLNNRPPTVRSRLRSLPATEWPVSVSSIVVYELWYGVARSGRQQENAERLRSFLSGNIRVLPFEEEDAAVAGELRAELGRAGTPIGPYDLLIASQAFRSDVILVTANANEFSRVPGLNWEDWTVPA